MNSHVIIGDNVKLHHNTTIGSEDYGGKSPAIGNNVIIDVNCVIIDGITIGDNSTIGTRIAITKDIPTHAIVLGNSTKVLRYKNEKA